MNTIGLARLAGVSGLSIFQAQPMLFFAVPTLGFMFFQSCGAIAGNNVLGKMFIKKLPSQAIKSLYESQNHLYEDILILLPVIQKMRFIFTHSSEKIQTHSFLPYFNLFNGLIFFILNP